jgi:uncharacterized protein (TIGR03067 family)
MDNSAKLNLAAAIIGAAGAISAAMLPIYLKGPAADPAPAAAKVDPPPPSAKPESAPEVASADTAPHVTKTDPLPHIAKAESTPEVAKPAPRDVAKPTSDSGPKAVGRADSKAGVSRKGAQPKALAARTSKSEKKTVAPEPARVQGQWVVVEQTNAKKAYTKEDLARTKPVWEIEGNKLTVRNIGDGAGPILFQGTIQFHPHLSPKSFDFTGKNRQDQPIEMLGIYTFDGRALILRYRIHHVGNSAKPLRPDSFTIDRGPNAGTLVRLARVKD